jgi:Ca-activated chloride channel family protein
MKTKRPFHLIVYLILLVLLAACGGGGMGTERESADQEPQATVAADSEEPADTGGSPIIGFEDAEQVEAEPVEEMAEESESFAQPLPASGGVAQATPLPMPTATIEGQEPPVDSFFEDYGVNPFIDSAEDTLSTFAIDVDTGSYTVMRGYVEDGYLPPDESVRVEEYVNYFQQDYALPEEGAFAIHLEGAPSPYGDTDDYYLVRVGVQGYDVPADQRPDATLIFVIDISGSMDVDNRLPLVRQSLARLVDNLRPTDRIGIVVYGDNARVLMEPTFVDARQQILDVINSIRPEGATNAEAGLIAAYDLAERYDQPGQITRLILCSDGVANVGSTTAEAILQHAQENIYLSTFGFGMGGYNDVLMEQLADQGNGAYAYIDDLDEAERIFAENLTSTLLTIAKDVKIQVEFNPSVVERYRLLGYENRAVADEDFRDDTVDAGEIGAGHSATALYEVRLVEEPAVGQVAMTVRVRYTTPDTNEIVEVARNIGQRDFVTSFESASARFQLTAVVAEYAEVLRNSYWAQNNDLNAVSADANRIAEYFPTDPDVQEFAQLVTLAAALR